MQKGRIMFESHLLLFLIPNNQKRYDRDNTNLLQQSEISKGISLFPSPVICLEYQTSSHLLENGQSGAQIHARNVPNYFPSVSYQDSLSIALKSNLVLLHTLCVSGTFCFIKGCRLKRQPLADHLQGYTLYTPLNDLSLTQGLWARILRDHHKLTLFLHPIIFFPL